MVPDWYLEMPIVTHGPGIALIGAIWYMVYAITKATREDLRAKQQRERMKRS